MTERHWPPVEFAPHNGPEPIRITTLAITVTTDAVIRSMYDTTGTVWIVVADMEDRDGRVPVRFGLDEVQVDTAGEIIPIGPILWEWLNENTTRPAHLDDARAHTTKAAT